MNLLTLINALLVLDIDISVKKAEALYNALGLGSLYSDLEYYKAEVKRLRAENDVLSQTQDEALSALRAKLVGQTASHDDLVMEALKNHKVLNLVAASRRVDAIKELREATGCTLIEGREAITDRRVQERAALSEWERDLLS